MMKASSSHSDTSRSHTDLVKQWPRLGTKQQREVGTIRGKVCTGIKIVMFETL